MITRFYLLLLSTNVKLPKFGCHVTSLCQGLRHSAGSGGEDPENQVVLISGFSLMPSFDSLLVKLGFEGSYSRLHKLPIILIKNFVSALMISKLLKFKRQT